MKGPKNPQHNLTRYITCQMQVDSSLNSVLSIVALNQEHSLTYTACISLMQQ